MLTAGRSFNHYIQTTKADDHILVTNGVYAWSRHPAYVGWFYWSLGTQVSSIHSGILLPTYKIDVASATSFFFNFFFNLGRSFSVQHYSPMIPRVGVQTVGHYHDQK